jgi:transketolase
MKTDLDNLCINTLRMLAVDMIEKAGSGHPGLPLGAAPMAHVLWSRYLRFNPKNPDWCDRDRFVLSAGHGSALLYALLHLNGYDLSLEDLKRFRQWGSAAPGHPERGVTPGVEVTTGPLGQGFANGVGLAMAERFLAARFNRCNQSVVDHWTYVLCSDGDLMEGLSYESASLAGHLKLGRLICLYDDNQISLAAGTRLTFSEDVLRRFEACGWQVLQVSDGNDLEEIDRAIQVARAEMQRPSLIMVRTQIGYGSPGRQGTPDAHGAPLGTEETAATKDFFGWPREEAFHIPEEALAYRDEKIAAGAALEHQWNERMMAWNEACPEVREDWGRVMRGELPHDWDAGIPVYGADAKPVATRSAGGEVMNAIARKVKNLIGGSADLDPSTKTVLKKEGSFQGPGADFDSIPGKEAGPCDYGASNIAFGVREHAMGAILNGLAAHGGIRPFGATFFVFSDYMRPAIRLAALSELEVSYVLTHDSVAVGEDGPTHQPVEHLAGFRAMPNLVVLRPADANETAEAWRVAMTHRGGPVMLVMSRQNLPVIDRQRFAPARGLRHGAYILAEASSKIPRLILIATGAEVHAALEALERLEKQGIPTRLVSMPSWELFEARPEDYREQVLPSAVNVRLAIEAGSGQGWHRYVGARGDVLCLNRFGASAPGEELLQRFGFSADEIERRALALLDAGQR